MNKTTEDERAHIKGKQRRHHTKTGRTMIQNGTLHRRFDRMLKRLRRDGVLNDKGKYYE